MNLKLTILSALLVHLTVNLMAQTNAGDSCHFSYVKGNRASSVIPRLPLKSFTESISLKFGKSGDNLNKFSKLLLGKHDSHIRVLTTVEGLNIYAGDAEKFLSDLKNLGLKADKEELSTISEWMFIQGPPEQILALAHHPAVTFIAQVTEVKNQGGGYTFTQVRPVIPNYNFTEPIKTRFISDSIQTQFMALTLTKPSQKTKILVAFEGLSRQLGDYDQLIKDIESLGITHSRSHTGAHNQYLFLEGPIESLYSVIRFPGMIVLRVEALKESL